MAALPPMPAAMLLAALAMALPMPDCPASRTIPTRLCGGPEGGTVTIPFDSAPPPGLTFARACHVCKPRDDDLESGGTNWLRVQR